jgi:hypothetical protein
VALFPFSPENGGASPGSSTLDVSDVVVDDLTTVELVASARVVDVVLLVARVVVVVDARLVVVVEATVVVVVATAVTTTTPVIPLPRWILQMYG